ncbi:hypothetical protein G3I59_09350 [Amycolatopsis rubida]|uniref:Peptidase C39-like domain-containing protein n=1 Tax=Amycolatopsis rubida TaxID=112413 RepID=A0A1I5ZCC4_9PSEU|nr:MULTISPECIES: hypothetical protein [Amycolatopsis]MYW90808.1 hypothetical protein [Amycolatopsis rubida]NEC55791.1 hypothetical protein [Amycolatopsis rubida]OAP26135.1 hypothetical protein A4R44_03513 [Amycolatopsis sp. M39]SFQ53787.1 hypothetical protein SAMN05421854_114173 [Amycolatopsis rubida]
MASVSPKIRRPGETPASKSGHLVLVHAATPGALVFHNPSGDTPESQRSAAVRVNDFTRFYAERAIPFTSPRTR